MIAPTDVLAEMIAAADETAASNSAVAYARWADDRRRGEWAVVLGHHRDSELLAESNYACALAELRALDRGDDVREESASHWAVGWVESILVRIGSPACDRAVSMREQLEDYPGLNESDFSEREWEEYQDTLPEAIRWHLPDFSADGRSIEEEERLEAEWEAAIYRALESADGGRGSGADGAWHDVRVAAESLEGDR